MDQFDISLRQADLMKQVMFENGVADFKALSELREFSKQAEQDGILEAVRYAKANPNDIEGARKLFKGKAKIGSDIDIAVENTEFGSTLVGYRAGADGKRVKVFDESDLLAPYISAQTFAQIKSQEKQTVFKDKGETTRTEISAGATIEAQRLRGLQDDQREANRLDIEGRRLSAAQTKEALAAIQAGVTSDIVAATRNQMNAMDSDRIIMIQREAASTAERLFLEDPKYKGKPNMARADATAAAFLKYGISTAPTFPKLNQKK
jgi:hypothetical protein